MNLHFRWMHPEDIPEILRIEVASFKHPWTEKDILCTMSHDSVVGMVVEIDDKIVGYMVYDKNEDFIDLMNIAVDPEYRHFEIGTMLVNKLISKVHNKRRELVAKVWERNVVAQMFLKKLGFCVVEILREDWDGEYGKDDSYIMMYTESLVVDAKVEDEKCMGVGCSD